jgi:hypothetical protein
VFKAKLQQVLDRRREDIQAILNDYGVPRAKLTQAGSLPAAR